MIRAIHIHIHLVLSLEFAVCPTLSIQVYRREYSYTTTRLRSLEYLVHHIIISRYRIFYLPRFTSSVHLSSAASSHKVFTTLRDAVLWFRLCSATHRIVRAFGMAAVQSNICHCLLYSIGTLFFKRNFAQAINYSCSSASMICINSLVFHQ